MTDAFYNCKCHLLRLLCVFIVNRFKTPRRENGNHAGQGDCFDSSRCFHDLETGGGILALCLALLLPVNRAGAVEAGYTVFHGSRDDSRIAITVDDCYDAAHVTEVLDLCEAYDIPVTFFVIGSALKQDDSAVWQRALSMGCEIGNHTWDHPRLPELNGSRIISQLDRTEEKLDRVLGWHYEMQVMRPPYGSLSTDPAKKSDIRVVEAIEKAGYLHAVRWDVSQTNPDQAIKDVQNGSILLYHANAKDVRCLTQLIPDLLAAGYEPVTVSALLGLEPPTAAEE